MLQTGFYGFYWGGGVLCRSILEGKERGGGGGGFSLVFLRKSSGSVDSTLRRDWEPIRQKKKRLYMWWERGGAQEREMERG